MPEGGLRTSTAAYWRMRACGRARACSGFVRDLPRSQPLLASPPPTFEQLTRIWWGCRCSATRAAARQAHRGAGGGGGGRRGHRPCSSERARHERQLVALWSGQRGRSKAPCPCLPRLRPPHCRLRRRPHLLSWPQTAASSTVHEGGRGKPGRPSAGVGVRAPDSAEGGGQEAHVG